MEVLAQVEVVAADLVASGRPIRWAAGSMTCHRGLESHEVTHCTAWLATMDSIEARSNWCWADGNLPGSDYKIVYGRIL